MPRSWQEDFFDRLVAASRGAGDARLATAKSHRRKKIGSFAHPQASWIECAFDTNRITGNQQSQVLVVEIKPKRASEIDSAALAAEIKNAGVGGDAQIKDGLILLQYRWGYGQGETFPLDDPRRLQEAVNWVHAALRVVFDHLERRRHVVTASVSADTAAPPNYTLALEKYLEDMLVEGLESLPWAASLQYIGRQVPCGDLGFIDILTQDRATGDFVVIELKRDKTDDEVVGQLTRYMGWIKEHRADPSGVGVRGIIVVHEVTPRLRAAVLSLANVELYNYRLAIDLRPAGRPGRS